MNTLPYLLIASLYLLLFYGCYWLMLRRNTFFGLNRAYLLLSIGLSLVLPFVELPGSWSSLPAGTNAVALPMFMVGATRAGSSVSLTPGQWLWVVYGLGVVVMLIRLGVHLRAIYRLLSTGQLERKPGYSLVVLPDTNAAVSSFSFGNYLVLNNVDAQTRPEALLRHELAHIRQRHTADILLIEFVQAAFWFNPVLWFYKRALQDVHEFLADRAASSNPVIRNSGHPDYARQLVAYALNVSPTALTTPFSSMSTLKQRIVMLQKPQTNRRALLAYASVLPLAGLLVMCTQSDHDITDTQPITINQPAPQATSEGEVFTVVEDQPEFPGGMKNLGAFLSQNLKYPAAAEKVNVTGRVFVSFIVTKTGDITDVKILKDIGFGTGEEAVRVMKLMPRWTPARQNGQLVNVRYNLPINFQLDDVDPSTSTLTPPPPPPPLESSTAATTQALNRFLIDGKEVSEKEFSSFPPARIASLNVTSMDPETGKKTGSIKTK